MPLSPHCPRRIGWDGVRDVVAGCLIIGSWVLFLLGLSLRDGLPPQPESPDNITPGGEPLPATPASPDDCTDPLETTTRILKGAPLMKTTLRAPVGRRYYGERDPIIPVAVTSKNDPGMRRLYSIPKGRNDGMSRYRKRGRYIPHTKKCHTAIPNRRRAVEETPIRCILCLV